MLARWNPKEANSDSRDVILPEKESRKKKFNDGVAASARTLELNSLPARPPPAVTKTKQNASKTRALQLAQEKEAVDVPREQRDQDEDDAV